MGRLRKKRGQTKVENNPQTFRDELIAVKETIAGSQIKVENPIKRNENLRCLNTLLVNDVKMEQESKTPFTFAFQVWKFLDQFVNILWKGSYVKLPATFSRHFISFR